VRVAIAGAGNVGQFIAADLLAAGHQVTLIEKDLHVVEVARPGLKEAEWFPFDACEVLSLVMAGVAHADVMVAATGDDEDNLVISLLAKQEFAVPRVVARVNHPKNEWLFNENWGVDVAVSTPHLILALTEEALSVGSLVRLLQLEKGRDRLVEVTLASDSPVIGPSIRELNIPRDSTFVAVVREDHVVVPRGDTVFQVGDEVIALVTPESEDEIRRILTGK
jgi:trk system potassium uptake protein TrkA